MQPALNFSIISDHFPVFCICSSYCNTIVMLYVTRRHMSDDNIVQRCLEAVNWDTVLHNTDRQEPYSLFLSLFPPVLRSLFSIENGQSHV